MTASTRSTRLLRVPAPAGAAERLTLYAMRRMAAHGIRDAYAANALFGAFGIGFQRPLVLLRAFMVEFAQSASRAVRLAPGCCGRMTMDEARMIAGLRDAGRDDARALRRLSHFCPAQQAGGALNAAAAYNAALADLGCPMG